MEKIVATSAKSTKANQTENFTFAIYNAKDEVVKYLHPDEVKSVPTLIGKLITDFPERVYFFAGWPASTMKIVIPSATGGKGEKERAGRAMLAAVSAVFAGMERDEVVTDSKKIAVLTTFKAKGFKFTCFTQSAVRKAVELKIKNQLQRIALQRESTEAIPENKVTIAQTLLIQEVRVIVKEKGNAAAAAFIAEKKANKLLPEFVMA